MDNQEKEAMNADDHMDLSAEIDHEGSQRYVEECIGDSTDFLKFTAELIDRKCFNGTAGDVQLKIEDFDSLRNGELVSAEIIDSYFNLIKVHLPNIHVIPSFSYNDWSKEKVKQWIQKVNIFEYDIFLFPVNLEDHWSIIVVDLKRSTITYYSFLKFASIDEIQNYADYCVNFVRELVDTEALEKLNVEHYCSSFNYCIQVEYSQRDEVDSGLLLCQFANAYCRQYRSSASSQSKNMIDLRMRMMIELACGKLIDL